MRVLLTRPEAQSRAFAEALRARFGAGVEIVQSPLLRIEMLSPEVDFGSFDGVVFTSQNGVAAFSHLKGADTLTAFCVGDRTADAARALGLEAISAGGDVAALGSLIETQARGQRLLHLSGAHVAGNLDGDFGASLTRVVAYDQQPVPLSLDATRALSGSKESAVPLFSPRTAALFDASLNDEMRARLHLVCLSPAVAAPFQMARFASLRICKAPTAASMMEQLGDLVAPRPA